MPADLLKALGLASTNSGTYLGSGEWSTTTDAGLLHLRQPLPQALQQRELGGDDGLRLQRLRVVGEPRAGRVSLGGQLRDRTVHAPKDRCQLIA